VASLNRDRRRCGGCEVNLSRTLLRNPSFGDSQFLTTANP
jgi:hypothetical protein